MISLEQLPMHGIPIKTHHSKTKGKLNISSRFDIPGQHTLDLCKGQRTALPADQPPGPDAQPGRPPGGAVGGTGVRREVQWKVQGWGERYSERYRGEARAQHPQNLPQTALMTSLTGSTGRVLATSTSPSVITGIISSSSHCVSAALLNPALVRRAAVAWAEASLLRDKISASRREERSSASRARRCSFVSELVGCTTDSSPATNPWIQMQGREIIKRKQGSKWGPIIGACPWGHLMTSAAHLKVMRGA